MTITNLTARDEIIAAIRATKTPFASDWGRAGYLAKGEMIRGIAGGFRNSVVFSPANSARADRTCDMLLFFGREGVLVHEEPARGGPLALDAIATITVQN